MDCGEADPVVLEFDHREGEVKVERVCRMVGARAAIDAIKAEVAKCDVRCANCHRRRTAKAFGFYRTRE